jgi:hypothetical protein
MTRFEWDPAKAQSNLRKHHIGFAEAQTIFVGPLIVTKADTEHVEQEERWLSIGLSLLGRLLVVAHTQEFSQQEEVIRIISARMATRQERRDYEETENG